MPRISNSQYWKERAERKVLAAEKSALEVSERLKAEYEKALKSIDREINAFYGRYALEHKMEYSDVAQMLTPSELKSYRHETKLYYDEVRDLGLAPKGSDLWEYLRGQSARSYMSRMEALKGSINREIEKLAAIENKTLGERLESEYTDAYYHTLHDISIGTDTYAAFTSINPDMVRDAITEDWNGANYSDRVWERKDKLIDALNAIIPQAIILGKNPRVFAKDIQKATGASYNAAVRLARTEFNRAANKATWDMYEDSGVVNKYRYLATLDLRTSEICQELDGKVFTVNQKEDGVNYPPLHPNCRSSTTPYFDDEDYSGNSRIARNIDGKNVLTDRWIDYKTWYKEYIEGGDPEKIAKLKRRTKPKKKKSRGRAAAK